MTQIIRITDKYFIEVSFDASGRPCAKLVQNTPKSKRSKTKTIKNYWFKSESRRDEWVAETVKSYQKLESGKKESQEQAKELAKTVNVKVGDIFVYSWGWEQTNIDFYQVTSFKGQTVILQEVKQNRTDTGWLQGTCTPIPNSFKEGEKPWRKRVKCAPDGKPYVSTEYGWCSLWDGKEEHWTAYA